MRTGEDFEQELEARGLRQIAEEIAKRHELGGVREMVDGGRGPAAVAARRELMRKLAQRPRWTLRRIGSLFGLDHSAAFAALKQEGKR